MPSIIKDIIDSFKGKYLSQEVADIIDSARIVAISESGPECAIRYIFEHIKDNPGSKAILLEEMGRIAKDFDVNLEQFDNSAQNKKIKILLEKIIRK
ncbi:MAG: hypothetical protein M1385_01535 [Candidatus Marsarchaeota archaeon]|nr:hypothetical protein [Candidatus Marsarchaeota archaeon]